MGSEFMPPLNEGSLLFMPVLLPQVSLSEVHASWRGRTKSSKTRRKLNPSPEKLGRAETPTDPAPAQMIETTIMLKPESQWRAGMTKDKLIRRID